MESDLVRHSRAGDVFHYRWAARRCLRMIDPTCPVKSITVEASKQPEAAGECVIDLTEYAEATDGKTSANYFQLKHSTLRSRKNFTFLDAKSTIEGFASRFRATQKEAAAKKQSITFSLVTNRPISPLLKSGIERIRSGGKATRALQSNLEKSTKLRGPELRAFCQALTLVDAEGDYISQKEKLHGEMTEYIAGFIDVPEVDHLIALVQERALPHSNAGRNKGEILPEDVLKRISGGKVALFPAPSKFESLSNIIPREQQVALLENILQNTAPTIIHAAGGVGKSVMARQMAQSLPNDSIAIVYDCFGGGTYRNESSPRHRPCDALVQIANELAAQGQCRPLIGHSGTAREVLFQDFLQRLAQATKAQQEINKKAKLIIIIDAGDNAEMVAEERGEHSFVKALLREPIPRSCHLVVLCRTERIKLLDPPSTVRRYLLKPFSKAETASHLRESFANASANDIEEFHRLTSGNPRVQSNALGGTQRQLSDILLELGPVGTSVDDQIAAQLDTAISKLRDRSPNQEKIQIDAICLGLANLPPFIPISVLAAAAMVDESAIHSFVSDLGRPLWHSENAVQFRDEPTETWFHQKFRASNSQIKSFVSLLEPLASKYTYVAKALPRLLLMSGDLKRLVSLSLSDELLPTGNPIDERDVRVYRLQFAFRAALKLGRLADAARLAFRAGEEMAGNQRQIELLGQNIDLVASLQDAQKVEDLAYNAELCSAWTGSENIYSAALLSSIKDFRGEAQGRFRAARHWLHIYFEERKTNKKKITRFEEKLKRADILEFVWTVYNLNGPKAATEYLLGWTPPDVAFEVGSNFVRRLVDAAKLSDIDEVAKAGIKSPHLVIALADQTSNISYFPAKRYLDKALNLLLQPKTRIERPKNFSFHDAATPAIISFAEACAARKLPKQKVIALLKYYTAPFPDRGVADVFYELPRSIFVRAAALKSVLTGNFDPILADVCIPKQKSDTQLTSEDQQKNKELLEVVGSLMPWYLLRARFICGDLTAENVDLETVRAKAKSSLYGRYQSNDILAYEMSYAWFKVLALKKNVSGSELAYFTKKVIEKSDRKFKLPDRLEALRSAVRTPHLAPLRDLLEESCRSTIELPEGTPEENSSCFIQLARAALPQSQADAASYFDKAVTAVSKFGDEMVPRWEAVVSVARRAAQTKSDRRELTYRFLQCAEMIGESVVREKYWNRDDVFTVAVRLHAPSAFAGLSRWRDRSVGHFSWQLNALASEAILAKTISPMTGWCLSGFLGCSNSADFAANCIRCEPSTINRQRILDAAIVDFKLNGAPLKSWNLLLSLAAELHLDQETLKRIVTQHEAEGEKESDSTQFVRPRDNQEAEKMAASYRKKVQAVDILEPTELDRLVSEQSESDYPRDPRAFWDEVIRCVPRGKEVRFLNVFLSVRNIGYYDIGYAISAIYSMWSKRESVRQHWLSFIFEAGKRFANEFADRHRLDFWLQMHPLDAAIKQSLINGIRAGLAEALELTDATTFFGFIRSVAPDLKPEEAQGLLDFSLERFEKHMDPKQGDGAWADWLKPPSKVSDAFAGLIWSALGSPFSVMRWQAVHCIRLLARNDCHNEIAALIRWMQSSVVGAFGGKDLPFYDLHARLYLLIALARVALESPQSLKRHANVFSEIAISGMPHALIQTTAATVANTLEQAYPDTYPRAVKSKLHMVGKTPFQIEDHKEQKARLDTPWHVANTVDTHLSLSFGIDFEPYWFAYLADVFGANRAQVTELIREVAVKELKVPQEDRYTPDPRRSQWRALGYNRKITTSHSHGSYPYVDDYTFYYAYHSMMSVAMRLLRKMPVVRNSYWGDANDLWQEWLDRHRLTRPDGYWLVDRRDPTPLKRRAWTSTRCDQNWQWQLNADDFIDVLIRQNPADYPICVGGWWADFRDDCIEDIQISSAWINPELIDKLVPLLRRSNPSDYGLPQYEGRNFEVNEVSFEVTGWLSTGEMTERGLDRFDPHACDILYPPLEIGASFVTTSGISSDTEKRVWKDSNSKGCLMSQCWSDQDICEEDKAYRYGRRLSATVEFLQELCTQRKQALIFDVRIKRKINRRYSSSLEDDLGYVPPSHKIFTFSSDGILLDSNKAYRL